MQGRNVKSRMSGDVATIITTTRDFVVKRTLLVPLFWNRATSRGARTRTQVAQFSRGVESALQISSRGGESDRAKEREIDKRSCSQGWKERR